MRLIPENVRTLLDSRKFQRAAIFIGLAVILLLFFSTLPFGGSGGAQEAAAAEDPSVIERELEQRLEELISRIDGVSSPKVMVTLDRTSQQVYAREERSSSSVTDNGTGSSQSSDSESGVVLVGSGSGKEALPESVVLPKVRGVAVVCSGAQDPQIKEKVVNAVSGVLNIGVSRVYVTY